MVQVIANTFKTPILLITFNRPDHTRRVFEEIRKQKPNSLFVFQDGPRQGVETDIEKCKEVRAIFDEPLEWECELKTFISETNMGCGRGPAAAITWFFDNVEQGIIFEDDCLPSESLFRFYEELLIKYKDDNRIGLITGTNLCLKWKHNKSDYFLSKTGGATMGSWASWRRVWRFFDYDMISWGDEECKKKIKNFVGNNFFNIFSEELNEFYNNGQTHSWDYQWAYARFLQKTFTVVSSVNQMSNIGFGEESTHTPYSNDRRANMQRFVIAFPLKNGKIKYEILFDLLMFYRFIYKKKKSLLLRVKLRLIEFIYCR